MNDSFRALTEAALKNLKGDPESKSSAITLLERLHQDVPDQIPPALARWDRQDSKKIRMPWRIVFHVTLAAISLGLFASSYADLSRYKLLTQGLTRFGSIEEKSQIFEPNRFTRDERLILNLPTGDETSAQVAKALWDSDPSNPAYFATYTENYINDWSRPPPDYLEVAARIDPNNAYFPFRYAGLIGGEAVRGTRHRGATGAGTAPAWTILDEPKLNLALDVIRKSRNLSEFRTYDPELLKQRIPLLPQANYPDYFASLAVLQDLPQHGVSIRRVAVALSAKAWLCGNRGEIGEFLEIKKDADQFLKHLMRIEPGIVFVEYSIQVSLNTLLLSLGDAADRLGLTAEAAELKRQSAAVTRLIDERRKAVFLIDGKPTHEKLSITLQNTIVETIGLSVRPPTLTNEDTTPRRMLDHELLAQFCVFASWVILGIAGAFAALYRFRSPKIVKNLSERLGGLLRAADWIWLGGAAIVPLLYVFAVIRLTPLGGTEVSISTLVIHLPYDGIILLPMAQFGGMILMIVILPILLARWRLGKRAAFIGFGAKGNWPGWIAFLSATASVPVIGWAVTHASPIGMKISWALFALPLSWILVYVMRSLTEGMTGLLQLTVVSRALVPAYTTAMLALLLTTPFLKWSRQLWFERDSMSRLDVAYPSFSKFEYETCVEARNELLRALQTPPAGR